MQNNHLFSKIYSHLRAAYYNPTLRKFSSYLIFILALGACVLTYLSFKNHGGILSKSGDFTLIYIDIAIFLITAFTVGQKLADLWAEKRRGVAGSRLQTKLISTFSFLAIFPCLTMIIFAATFFHGEIETWFTKRNHIALTTARQVAESYLKEHQKNIINDANAVSFIVTHQMPGLYSSEEARNNFISQLAALKSLADIVVFDRSLTIFARSKFSFAAEFAPINTYDLEKALQKKIVLISGTDYRFVRALIATEIGSQTFFILVGRPLDVSVLEYMEKTKNTVQQYEEIQGKRWHLEASFILVFLVLGCLLLLAAISVALTTSWQLIKPISRLINAAEKINNGDLNARVPETNNKSQEELGMLGKVFNQMVNGLVFQKKQLEDTNSELHIRQKFTENVLSSVSSGILSLDSAKKIVLANKSINSLFHTDINQYVGKPVYKIFPELNEILLEVDRLNKKEVYETELQIKIKEKHCFLFIRVALEQGGGQKTYVVTVDDLTDLFVAQKKAAWSDVARRVAHEIKNPLTPIQLAAERLKRKYKNQISENEDTFSKLISTIIDQVDDIRRLTDEFSLFARLPDPVFNNFNLVSTFEDALFFHQAANTDIIFKNNCKYATLTIDGDARMLHQAVCNVIINSINAIRGVDGFSKTPEILGNILEKKDEVLMIIEDNGPGFPDGYIDKLTDPYVTLTKNGSGLGLSIVKKIILDHGGDLSLENRSEGGARLTMSLPKKQNDS